jgi:hypothetical protein
MHIGFQAQDHPKQDEHETNANSKGEKLPDHASQQSRPPDGADHLPLLGATGALRPLKEAHSAAIAAPFALMPVNFAATREEAYRRRRGPGAEIVMARSRPRPEN